MSPDRTPSRQPDAGDIKPKRALLRVALGVFLLVELHFAITRSWYDIRTRDLLKLVLLFSAVRMVAGGLPEVRTRGLAAWIRAVFAVLLLVVGEIALLLPIQPITWTPFALGVGCLTAAVLVARLRLPPGQATRTSARSA